MRFTAHMLSLMNMSIQKDAVSFQPLVVPKDTPPPIRSWWLPQATAQEVDQPQEVVEQWMPLMELVVQVRQGQPVKDALTVIEKVVTQNIQALAPSRLENFPTTFLPSGKEYTPTSDAAELQKRILDEVYCLIAKSHDEKQVKLADARNREAARSGKLILGVGNVLHGLQLNFLHHKTDGFLTGEVYGATERNLMPWRLYVSLVAQCPQTAPTPAAFFANYTYGSYSDPTDDNITAIFADVPRNPSLLAKAVIDDQARYKGVPLAIPVGLPATHLQGIVCSLAQWPRVQQKLTHWPFYVPVYEYASGSLINR